MTMISGSCSVSVVFPMNTVSGEAVDDVDSPIVVSTSGEGMAKVLIDAFVPFLVTPAFTTCDPNNAIYAGLIAAGKMTTAQAREQATQNRKIVRSGESWNFATQLANAIAAGVVSYIKSNAVVDLSAVVATVSSQQVGRTPSPNNPNTNIQAPSSPVTLPVTNGVSTSIGIT